MGDGISDLKRRGLPFGLSDAIGESQSEKQTLQTRRCTCHPDDNPPDPCPEKYALSDCRAAEIERLQKLLNGRDRFIVSRGLWQDFVDQLGCD
jgi:hypothetical protein